MPESAGTTDRPTDRPTDKSMRHDISATTLLASTVEVIRSVTVYKTPILLIGPRPL